MEILRGNTRGHADHGWLDTRHTFSFGDYYDPRRMGFGALRVINDDRIAPGAGFPTHPHRDMEIVSYVVEGALQHRDTLGTGSVIRPGEVQRMSAGRGVAHSEFNASGEAPVRMLQIWLHPDARGKTPSYAQEAFPRPANGDLQLLVSAGGEAGALSIGQDARILRYLPAQDGQPGRYTFDAGRSGWLQVVNGTVELSHAREGGDLERVTLGEGDAVALPEAGTLTLEGRDGAEALLFDIPKVED